MRARSLSIVVLLCGGCFGPEPEEIGQRREAVAPLTWRNLVRVEAVGASLTKTGTKTTWDAGASSYWLIAGDGYVEFSSAENTTDKMAGLGADDINQDYIDIEFAIRLKRNGGVAVFESGTLRGNFGSYVPGDRFRVQALGGVVTYWKNGALFHTSALTPPDVLRVDTSLRDPGATITDVDYRKLTFWQDVVGARAVLNDLEKTAVETTWKAGAISKAVLTGDGFVEFTTGESDKTKIAGLGSGNSGPGLADVEFGIYLKSTGKIAVRENGVSRGNFGPYAPGDVFRVSVSAGVVSYARNGVTLYTSGVAPTFPLVLDTSLRDPGATINDARVEACSAPVQTVTELSAWPGGAPLDVSAADDLLVIGNPEASSAAPPSAAVFRRGADGWTLEQLLTRTDGHPEMGDSVATDGQTIVVGDLDDDTFGTSGTAQIYRQDLTGWQRQALVRGCSADDGFSFFGIEVAVQGDVAAVGEERASAGFNQVHVFRRSAGAWRREATLHASDASSRLDFFGRAIAIGGDRLFVGASGNDTAASAAGAVYVFRHDAALPDPGLSTCSAPNQGKWVQEAILYAPDAQAHDRFPGSLDTNASGTLFVAGNTQHGTTDDGAYNGPGAAYIFERSGGSWQLAQQLVPSHGKLGDEYGSAVAFGGPDGDVPDLLVIGAPTPHVNNSVSSVYVYEATGGQWSERAWLRSPGPEKARQYGASVAATADQFMVAEHGSGDVSVNSNSVYIYDDQLECPAP